MRAAYAVGRLPGGFRLGHGSRKVTLGDFCC